MARKILDREFRDNLYTEPQALEDISMLDDVRRTVPYSMVFDGRRWIKQRPRVGGVRRHSSAMLADVIPANEIETLLETPRGRRGQVITLSFRASSTEMRPELYIDDSLFGLHRENIWSMTNDIQSLHEKGDEDGIWKLTKYDTTNDHYAMHLMLQPNFNNYLKFKVHNQGDSLAGAEYDMVYTLIDDRIPRREK